MSLMTPLAPLFLRSAAAWALGRIGTEEATERLIAAFSDINIDIREEALAAVDGLGQQKLSPLLDALSSEEEEIAAGAAEALRRSADMPAAIVDALANQVQAAPHQVWAVWLLGHLPQERLSARSAIARLQDSAPAAHYALSVLWSFTESWIAPHWELRPCASLDSAGWSDAE
jgi:HEAT repeat protein